MNKVEEKNVLNIEETRGRQFGDHLKGVARVEFRDVEGDVYDLVRLGGTVTYGQLKEYTEYLLKLENPDVVNEGDIAEMIIRLLKSKKQVIFEVEKILTANPALKKSEINYDFLTSFWVLLKFLREMKPEKFTALPVGIADASLVVNGREVIIINVMPDNINTIQANINGFADLDNTTFVFVVREISELDGPVQNLVNNEGITAILATVDGPSYSDVSPKIKVKSLNR